ncbi:MAG: hypothetical protein QM526_02020 [Alphaproteobacteria bacterium]|nr:hypothetical protein [Alphaproteobacteria bacterium]
MAYFFIFSFVVLAIYLVYAIIILCEYKWNIHIGTSVREQLNTGIEALYTKSKSFVLLGVKYITFKLGVAKKELVTPKVTSTIQVVKKKIIRIHTGAYTKEAVSEHAHTQRTFLTSIKRSE